MASLYEIDSNIKAIIDSIYNSDDFEDGEINEADFTALEQLQADRKAKLENIALYAKNCDAEAQAIKAEIETLTKRMKRLQNKSEGLGRVLLKSMSEAGDSKFETSKCAIKIRNSEQTEIIDINLIPKEYIVVKTTEQPDKTAIKKAIKAGMTVAGAQIIEKANIKIE